MSRIAASILWVLQSLKIGDERVTSPGGTVTTLDGLNGSIVVLSMRSNNDRRPVVGEEESEKIL